MQQYGSIYLPRNPLPPTLCVRSKGQNPRFSKHGYVAYQIKGNAKCSNIQAHILSLHTPSTQGGVKGENIFSEVVMLHIKLMGMEYRAPCKHIFCPYIHPRPLGCDQKSKHFFTESSHVAYQSKGNKT